MSSGESGELLVLDLQRSRVLAAALREAAEAGREATSVGVIVGRAGVSRRTFYDLFGAREDCFEAVFEHALAEIADVVAPAYEGTEGRWAQRLRAALVALLAFLERDRELATFALSYVVEGPAGESPAGAECLKRLRQAVEDGRHDPAGQVREPSPVTEEVLVAGVLALLHTRVRERSWHLNALANPLMSMLVMPYLGPAAAARELRRSPPRRTASRRAAVSDPLVSAGMRVTYRTARVLRAIAERPRSNNTEIGLLAGMTDPGQASKMLARLLNYGLVENVAGPLSVANAWQLTPRGNELAEAMAPRFSMTTGRRVSRSSVLA